VRRGGQGTTALLTTPGLVFNEVQDQDGGRTGARSYDIREAVARREREGAFRTTKTMADEERSHNWTGNYSKGLAARLLSC
jgi:hypothetical protein